MQEKTVPETETLFCFSHEIGGKCSHAGAQFVQKKYVFTRII
jgi:hypothetical protein